VAHERLEGCKSFASSRRFLLPWPGIAGHDLRVVLSPEDDPLPKFVIEREIPAAGKLPPDQLKAISQKSCAVLRELGPQIQWIESFVTDDKLYCVYIAPDEATVRQHAEKGGFPANRISQVRSVIDPTTSE